MLKIDQARKDLNDAADLIEKTGWTIDACARNAEGKDVKSNAPDACAFCVSGALRRVTCETRSRPGQRYLAAANMFTRFVGTESIAEWNDEGGRTKDEVIKALREAART